MRIGVVSDSHGNLYMLDKALSNMGNLDCVIHLGDHYKDILKINDKYKIKTYYVSGNNDFGIEAAYERLEEICGKRIFMTHGHKYGVYYGVDKLYFKALEYKADIVLYGHTHIQSMNERKNILFLNPGSVSLPRDSKPGCALIEINGSGDIEVKLMRIEY